MKCQKCSKEATVHITDLVGEKPVQYHLCEEHAQEFFQSTQQEFVSNPSLASSLATHLAQKMAFSKVNSEFLESDQEMCNTCGMCFAEFRATSRLGCPEDYRAFEKMLTPLLMNIQGEIHHTGKVPRHFGESESRRLSGLIHKRRELSAAITNEKYEEASVLRDEIKKMESEAGIE